MMNSDSLSNRDLKIGVTFVIVLALIGIYKFNGISYNVTRISITSATPVSTHVQRHSYNQYFGTTDSKHLSYGNADTPIVNKSASVINKTGGHHQTLKSGTNIFYRTDAIPEETGHLPFLENYKNPCWREIDDENRVRVRCLPYFYMAAFPKCGTTDFYTRVKEHPQISSRVGKEHHWITRFRFMDPKLQYLSSYLKFFDTAVEEDISKLTYNNTYHPMVIGDCTPSLLWHNGRLLRKYMHSNLTIPPLTNADVVHGLTPNAKIIVFIRNPVTRFYSDYLYFHDVNSVQDFHERVLMSIKSHQECAKKYSIRHCAYFPRTRERLHVGMYHIYIEDFMRVFPREQIKVIKLEDHSSHMAESLTSIFKFLDLDKPSNETMQRVLNITRRNVRNEGDKAIGDMLPETWQQLVEFYKPYNRKLVQLLGENYRY